MTCHSPEVGKWPKHRLASVTSSSKVNLQFICVASLLLCRLLERLCRRSPVHLVPILSVVHWHSSCVATSGFHNFPNLKVASYKNLITLIVQVINLQSHLLHFCLTASCKNMIKIINSSSGYVDHQTDPFQS